MKPLFLPVLLIIFAFTGCKKDAPAPSPSETITPSPTPQPGKKGTVSLAFANRVGGQELVLGKPYKLLTGDSITVSTFNYYISNVVLVDSSGATFVQPESYFVVRHPEVPKLTVTAVPKGKYVSVRFLIGVDSARNCSGAQTGGLDLGANLDMYWSWNNGYIFMKLEATSPQSGSADGTVKLHVGGFKDQNKAQRSVAIDFSGTPLIINDDAGTINLNAELNKLFTGVEHIGVDSVYHIMGPGANAKKIADNYAGMFSLESVKK